MKKVYDYIKQAEEHVRNNRLKEAGQCIKRALRMEDALGRNEIARQDRFKKLLRDLARKGVQQQQ